MPPTSSKPPPLPLAPDRAAISNKISLLLSNRTSLLKTLNPLSSSSAQTTTATTRRYPVNADDIEQLFSGPRPNEGVGYVPDRKAAAGDAAAKEDRMLRGRLLGKGAGKGSSSAAGRKKVAAESESDEEPGRSGLGKRKRPRREHEAERNEEAGGDQRPDEMRKEEVEEDMEEGRDRGDGEDAAPVQGEEVMADINGGDDAKRNKKKRKRQREKEKQKQKKLGNAS